MLFERQRLLLTLLDALGGSMGHTDFQKLLFLYTKEFEEVPSYEFVPYRFGGFSFTSHADKRRLIAAGLLEDLEHQWQITKEGLNISRTRAVDPLNSVRFCKKYAEFRGNTLIAEVYRKYPYYATRSEVLEKVPLSAKDRETIAHARPHPAGPGLLTIGYEGRTLENYLNLLLKAGVTLLCDVRRNPLSRKYGFSKGTLSKASEGVGIRYEHLPELGIDSSDRKNLETQEDYDALFLNYAKKSLPLQTETLTRIRQWIVKDRQRVALTCFELQPHQCHRHCVAEALETASGECLTPVHL